VIFNCATDVNNKLTELQTKQKYESTAASRADAGCGYFYINEQPPILLQCVRPTAK